MALKDTWIPQNETMDASPEIPNMLAEGIINNETQIDNLQKDIDVLKEAGNSGETEVFVVNFNSETKSADKTYDEILEATKQHKMVMLYEGETYLASLSSISPGGMIFLASDLFNVSVVTEYVFNPSGEWAVDTVSIIKNDLMNDYISAGNPYFVNAVIESLPDADTMRFPLENEVSEVTEE